MIDNMCENVDRSLEHGSRGDRECIFTHSQNFFSRTRRDKMQFICTLLQFAVVDTIFSKSMEPQLNLEHWKDYDLKKC